MRIAVVSDIHGNLTAFEAVLVDLRKTAPDVIFHGGDLAHAGSSPAEIVDRIRHLGWPGVMGNTDELLPRPKSLEEFAQQSAGFRPLYPTVAEMAAFTRERLGEERLEWLQTLPLQQAYAPMALVHASPADPWRSPNPESPDAELQSTYGSLAQPIAVYGHIHCPFVRKLDGLTVVNTGSVSLSYDGDPRASYLLIEDGVPTIRRVEYEMEREIKLLERSRLPHWDWVAKMLRSARPEMP